MPKDTQTYLNNLLQDLKRAHEIASKNVLESQDQYKQNYDSHAKHVEFNTGDKVWLHCPQVPIGMSSKLHSKWTGPYYIAGIGPNNTYCIRHCVTNKEQSSLIHANRLKLHHSEDVRKYDNENGRGADTIQDSIDSQPNSSQIPESKDEWQEVDKLLGTAMVRGKRHYHVKWKHKSKTTWEPDENISERLKRDFHINKTLSGKRRKRKSKLPSAFQ